jgi:hypothetical protein
MTSALCLAGQALRDTLRHPGIVGLVYLARLAIAAAFALVAARALAPVLEGRPAPELRTWVLLVRADPAPYERLALYAAAFALLHFLLGTVVAGLTLRRLCAVDASIPRLRSLARLALLRLGALVVSGALLAGWGLAAYRLGALSLALDDRGQIAIQLALALVAGLPLLALLVTLQLAQAEIARGRGLRPAARAALQLLHARPACALLALVGWVLLAGLGLAHGSLALEQAAAVGTGISQVWAYAWVVRVSSPPPG